MIEKAGNYSFEFNKKERLFEIHRNGDVWRLISAFSLKEGLYYLIDELISELNQSEEDVKHLNKIIDSLKNGDLVPC